MTSLEILIATIIEQQYRFHLIAKALVAKGVLKPGELDSMFNEKERFHFSHDLLEHLVSIGLKIDESSLSALTTATPSALELAAREATDRASKSKS